MKAIKLVRFLIPLLLLGVAGAGNAWADHRRHSHFSVMIGPAWGPSYYSPDPYFYPRYYPYYVPPVVIDRPLLPQVYIEQPPLVAAPPAPSAPAAAPASYWYFCAASNAYYPYVNECPGGWQKMLPQPPAN